MTVRTCALCGTHAEELWRGGYRGKWLCVDAGACLARKAERDKIKAKTSEVVERIDEMLWIRTRSANSSGVSAIVVMASSRARPAPQEHRIRSSP